MVFSSVVFLFFFLPIFLGIYFLVPSRFKNFILLIFSLIFYAWGEPVYILLMIFSSVLDYTNGILLEKINNKKVRKLILIESIIANLSLLGVFKYSDFLITNFNNLFHLNISLTNLALPIGISFFTFQTMSYTIDVYKKEIKAEHNFINFMAYVSMFPQLIAGPIVRYSDIKDTIKKRKVNFNDISLGFMRFLKGLFKKVLIANLMGSAFSEITASYEGYSALTCLFGILAYTLQIYYDFSGYSDMAIGMGKMMGFNYPENFNYPYASVSITDFWRRWHISLSSFFKEYVYIPLGGSKKGKAKMLRNILVVWFLTGLWHGASWNFILWGLYFGILLLIEKFFLKKYLDKWPSFFKHLYALIFIVIGWLIFAFDDINKLWAFTKAIFNFNNFIGKDFFFFLGSYGLIFIVGIIFSFPIMPKIIDYISKGKYKNVYGIFLIVICIILFMITTALLVSNSYNPFLYFRF